MAADCPPARGGKTFLRRQSDGQRANAPRDVRVDGLNSSLLAGMAHCHGRAKAAIMDTTRRRPGRIVAAAKPHCCVSEPCCSKVVINTYYRSSPCSFSFLPTLSPTSTFCCLLHRLSTLSIEQPPTSHHTSLSTTAHHASHILHAPIARPDCVADPEPSSAILIHQVQPPFRHQKHQ
jgi:hypothetical protein